MPYPRNRIPVCALALWVLAASPSLPAAANASDAGSPPASPPAGDRSPRVILADYAAAIGGAQAWRRHRTVRIRREIEAKGMNIRGTETRYGTAAGKTLTITEIPGIGRFRQGSDGRVRWSEEPINGLRRLTGAEDEEAKLDATWDGEVRLVDLYDKVRAAQPPVAPPAGQRYECVELVPRAAAPAVACFDARTHLRVLQKGTRATPQGDTPYLVKFGDWREVGGMKMPYSEEMTAGPTTLVARVVEVALDEKLDSKLFAVPRPHPAPREK
jgi:hypothetical protein